MTRFWELTRFFTRESRHYIGPYTWRDRRRWPLAYVRFLAYAVWDSPRVLALRVAWYRWRHDV